MRPLTQQALVAGLRGVPSQCVMTRSFWNAPGVSALFSGKALPIVTIVFVACAGFGDSCTDNSVAEQREAWSIYRQCVRQVCA